MGHNKVYLHAVMAAMMVASQSAYGAQRILKEMDSQKAKMDFTCASVPGPWDEVYEEGYRAGWISNITNPRWGYDIQMVSTQGVRDVKVTHSNGSVEDLSPWVASLWGKQKSKMFDDAHIRQGDRVVMRYETYTYDKARMNWFLNTNNGIVGVKKINPQSYAKYFEQHPKMELGFGDGPSNLFGSYEAPAGYIVKASRIGYCHKTWEIVLQTGANGGDTIALSIQNFKLYRYAVAALVSGRKVIVHYTNLDRFGRWTNWFIHENKVAWGIEVLPIEATPQPNSEPYEPDQVQVMAGAAGVPANAG